MNSITMHKHDLISHVLANRKKHAENYKLAMEKYNLALIRGLEKLLKNAKRGKKIKIFLDVREPEEHLDEYDRVLEMLELSIEDKVDIREDDFERYIRDKWEWSRSFALNTSSYLRK